MFVLSLRLLESFLLKIMVEEKLRFIAPNAGIVKLEMVRWNRRIRDGGGTVPAGIEPCLPDRSGYEVR